jgi:DNA-binding NarL/FixJ family response regulator
MTGNAGVDKPQDGRAGKAIRAADGSVQRTAGTWLGSVSSTAPSRGGGNRLRQTGGLIARSIFGGNSAGSRDAARSPRLTVAIVAESERLRIDLLRALANTVDLKVVYQAASVRRLMHVGTAQAEVVVADLSTLAAALPRVVRSQEWLRGQKVVFVAGAAGSTVLGPETIRLLMTPKCFGFLTPEACDRIGDAIRLVAAGTFTCDMEAIKPLFLRLSEWAGESPNNAPFLQPLSLREVEVFQLVAKGLTNKQIAERMVLSEGTVKAHVSHIMTKLAMENRSSLVRYALTRELAPLLEADAIASEVYSQQIPRRR